MATADRLAALNSEEKDAVVDNINAKNTKRQNMDLDFENCSLEHLDQTLSNFYMEMRNKKGDMYSKIHTSIRQGIQRHISETRDIDLISDAFKTSNKAFQCKKLKMLGLAVVNHYPHIEDTDLTKMYSRFASNSAASVQRKST